jgi:hypothetical protein
MFLRFLSLVILAALSLLSLDTRNPNAELRPPDVVIQRVPDGGIQPQAAVDTQGTVHVVYFKGEPLGGDLYYVHSKDGLKFSSPIRVNSKPGSAVARGDVRGPRIATGRLGHVYVVWNGSDKATEGAPGSNPMLYTSLNADGTSFLPERNLIHTAYGLDGGGSVVADQKGRVYVFWHAPLPGSDGEASRRVWISRSDDDGKTFGPERVAWNEATGACGCCSLNSHIDPSGAIYVIFRSAKELVHRDMYMLRSQDLGRTFRGQEISQWSVGACVMSTEAFTSGTSGTFAAWETEKQVHFGKVETEFASVSDLPVSKAEMTQKYPSLAMNPAGALLVAWTEGMSKSHEGSLHWQAFDGGSRRLGIGGSAEGVLPLSSPAAYPLRNGKFAILY